MGDLNQDVTGYIEKISQPWQIDICKQLREAVHKAIPEVTERIQYGKPHFLKNGKYACVMGTAKGWVSFTVFNAAALEAPADLFEPDGPPERKTIKVTNGRTVDYDLLTTLIRQAASTI